MYEKEVVFKNWTKENFQEKFNSLISDFEAGASYRVPSGQAYHFAKKLAIRELHREGKDGLPEKLLNEYIERCFPDKAHIPQAGVFDGKYEKISLDNGDSNEEKPENRSENTTVKDVQNKESEEDETTEDEKNNAGAPKIKGRKASLTKDAQYVVA